MAVNFFNLCNSKSERGAGMAEYVLLLALVAAAMIAAFTGLVDAMVTQVGNIAGLASN